MYYLLFVSSVQKELATKRRAVSDFIHGDALLRRFFDVFFSRTCPSLAAKPASLRRGSGRRAASSSRRCGDPSRRKPPRMEEELSAEVQRLLHATTGEMTRRDIQNRLGLKHREHFYDAHLSPALATGLVERTAPDKPTNRLQRNRLTEKGRAWLAACEPGK